MVAFAGPCQPLCLFLLPLLPFFFACFFGFDFALDEAGGVASGVMSPAPWNVALAGVRSLGAENGVEQESPSHSTGRGGAGGSPPPERTSYTSPWLS